MVNGDLKTIKDVFWQLQTIRLFFAGFICSVFFFLSESFVKLWVGDEYVMSLFPMSVLLAVYFIQMSRTCDIFLSAYGLFQDIWAPVLESISSIVFSVLFGYFWGISGIFLGILLSQLAIVNSWKPYFLYK